MPGASYQEVAALIASRMKDFSPLLPDVGDMLRSSVSRNFAAGGRYGSGELGGGARRWLPSGRAKAEGGITLSRDGHLATSIRWDIDAGGGIVLSSNLVYAAIHNFGSKGLPGGVIRPKSGKFLRFTIGGAVVFARAVEIPARPFLVVQEEDVEEIGHMTRDFLAGRF